MIEILISKLLPPNLFKTAKTDVFANKHTPNYNKSTDFSTSYSSPGGRIDKQYSP